jgi:hypothetical protein
LKRLPSYRLYRLDEAGKIATGEWIEAPHDEDAVRLANERAGEGKHELWDGRRLVARIGKDAGKNIGKDPG